MLLAEPPAAVELWVHEGRMLRLDLPEASISVRRTDLAAAAP
jgi:hypothetical protein